MAFSMRIPSARQGTLFLCMHSDPGTDYLSMVPEAFNLTPNGLLRNNKDNEK